MSEKIVHLNEEVIKVELKELVRSSVEETLNGLLEQEAHQLTNAAKYERSEDRQGYRSGHYSRNLTTTSGDVELKMPKLKGVSFETAIIERYRRRESSVEEALIEMYLAGVSVRRVEDITEALWGSKVSPATISELNKKAYVHIEDWRNRPLQGGKYPYVYVDGIYLKRNWGGEYENVAILVAIAVNEDGYREVIGAAEGMKEDKQSWVSFFQWLKSRGLSEVKLVVGDKCLGMLEAVGEVFPDAKYQRCTVHFYRNVFSVTPRSKVKLVAKMLKAIHAQESKNAAREKAKTVIQELRVMKLPEAAKKVEDGRERRKICVKVNRAHSFRQEFQQRKNKSERMLSLMEKTPATMIKDFVNSQKFENTSDVMAAMKEMFADVLQQVMECELEQKLGYEKSERVSNDAETAVSKNYRNGYSKKTVKTQLGEVDIRIPRDRNGEYEPQIVSKYDRNADGMEEKIIGLYACGLSQRDIAEQIKALYDVEISPELVSKISEKIMPEVTAWQNRPLDAVYPFVFLDAIHYKVKENHQYVTKAAYVVLGINTDGRKDILGIWIGQHESAKFWAGVLNDLKSRGVKDVYLFCVDGLNGFREAINATYPQAQIQRCIIHQIRSSTRYVSWKDIKALMADLKKVYQSVTEDEALSNLMTFKDIWGKQYPSCVKSWEENWDILSTFYAYPPEMRKIIYTTNIIEGLNRQFRKITKNKPSFTNDDSLRKILYLASKNIVEHWTARCRNWDQVISHLDILFGDRQAG